MVVGLTSGVGDETVEFLEVYPDPSFVKKLIVGRWSLCLCVASNDPITPECHFEYSSLIHTKFPLLATAACEFHSTIKRIAAFVD